MPRKVKPFDRNYACDLYVAGESVKDIAKRFEVSVPLIDKILRANQIPRRDRRAQIPADEVCSMFNRGDSVLAIGKHFSVARNVIARILTENNIAVRSGSDAMKLRMQRMSVNDRLRLASNAHAAVKGQTQSEEHRCKIAQTREAKQLGVSDIEIKCKALLDARGLACVTQKAHGRYNIDIAITEPCIAVEIFGGQWHGNGRHANRFRKRTDHLIDSGWAVVIVWVTGCYPLSEGAIEYIVSLSQMLSHDESLRSQEHVIRGDGQPTAIGNENLNYRAAVGGDKCGPLIRREDGRFGH